MSLQVKEEIMAPETWGVDIDYTPVVKSLLVDTAGRPRKLHALIYNEADELVYPPLVLLHVDGDEEGLHLEGYGVLWHLGAFGVGPTIVDREYVSGFDKLSNGSFTLVDEADRALYWRTASENSLWVFEDDNAENAGGYHGDDVLESDEKFPTRPGYEYRAQATGVFGTGRLRVRIIFEGRFSPPNLLVNGDMEDGPGVGWSTADNIDILPGDGRSGLYGMWISPIPKPQLVSNHDFAAGATGWTLGSTFSIVTGGLIAGPNDQPQYITDPHFETLSGWTDDFTPAPMSNDIDIIADGTHARTGTGVMRVGPITQHQVLTNADFSGGFNNWYVSSDGPLTEPDPTWWNTDATEGNNGTACVRTIGWSTAGAGSGPLVKYLRADSVSGGGVEPYDVKPGESYRLEAYTKAAPGTEGQAYVSVQFPHPTVPGHDTWILTEEIEGTEHADMRWNVLSKEFTVPNNRFQVNVLAEVHNHGLGYWYWDTITLTRTRGNRAQINYDTSVTVIPDTRYLLSALVRSGDDMSGGNVRFGVVLTGSGVDPLVVDVDKGNTDFEWTRVNVEVRPPTDYDTATPFVAGLDITGDSVWLDAMTFTKVENNTDVTTHAPFAVVPDQRYLLAANLTAIGATRGTVTVGVTLSGSGIPDQDFEINPGTLDDLKTKAISTEVRPPAGYTSATVFVRSTDIEGGVFAIDDITFTKADNNSDSTTSTIFAVTPERTYRWVQAVKSGANLQRGTVKLSARCIRADHDDVVFDSSEMSATDGDWKFIDFSFTPPSGYEEVEPRIIGTDVEGAFWYLDDGEIRDTDTGSVVFDASSGDDPVNGTPFVDATAPEGSETVRVVVLNEEGSSEWMVGAVSLKRTGVTPATGNAIVAELLTDPTWHHQLSIEPGTIDAPDVIPYDWVIQNQTDRDALDHLCNVVYDGGLEYHVNATAPATIDVAPSVDLFEDHGPDSATPITLLPEDIDVQELDDPEVDVSERATVIRLYGAERQTVSGRPFIITATAEVPGATEYDYNGHPIQRVKPVNDGTVDHHGYAQAYATDLALRESEPALNLNVKLSGKDTRPPFDVGDWLYCYHPEAGLQDTAYVQEIEGQTVFPRRVRVLSRERALGPSYRIVMRRHDGSTFDLPGVLHSPEDATVLTIGDRLPDWVSDPQGKAPGVEYLRDRASRPR